MAKYKNVIRRETQEKRDIDGNYIDFLNCRYYFSNSMEESDTEGFEYMNTFDKPYSTVYFRKIFNGNKNERPTWEAIQITY